MLVPLVMSLVVVCCQVTPLDASDASIRTFGESGPVCTRNGKRCVTQAMCDNTSHDCVCPAGHKGDGTIECIRDNQELCLSLSDPHVRTFGGAAATLAFPCRHRLTRFTTPNTAGNPGSAVCAFEVFGVSIMTADGRFYERQMEISLAVGDFVDQEFVQADIRKMGINQKNVFDFFFSNKGQLTPWGSTVHDTWNGVNIFCTFDFENNFAILEVKECDVRFKFRPHNSTVSALTTQIPGITIAVPRSATFTLKHGGFPASLCGTLDDHHNLYKVKAAELGFTDLYLLLTYQVLKSAIHQNVDDIYHSECTNSISLLKGCGDQVKAVQVCGSLLGERKTLRCLLDKAVNPMATFVNCLQSVCTGSHSACQTVQNDVSGCHTSKLIKQLTC